MGEKKLQEDPKMLMELAKAGDKEAFGRIYELYFVPVFRYIYFFVKSREEAEDLTQTVFIKIFSSLSKFNQENKSPLAYFLTVSKNTVIDYWRSKKNIFIQDSEKVFEELHNENDNPLKIAKEKEFKREIQIAIKHLTEAQREVIVLKFINDMKNKEIADYLGKTEEAVRQLQCRALKSLRSILKYRKFKQ